MHAERVYKTLLLFLVKLLILLLSSCQAYPKYSPAVQEELSKVYVLYPNSQEGKEVYRYLRMYCRGGGADYLLKVNVLYETDPFIVLRMLDHFGSTIVQEVQYELTSHGKVLLNKIFKVSSFYHKKSFGDYRGYFEEYYYRHLGERFDSYFEEQRVRQELGRSAANGIIRDIAIFLQHYIKD